MIDKAIKTHGQFLQGVIPSRNAPGMKAFVYTIGNALHGLPELLTVGPIDPEITGYFMNELGDDMRSSGKPFPEGLLDHHNYSFPFLIHKCSPAAQRDWTIQAGQYLGREDYEVLQIILPDNEGRWPGDDLVQPIFDVPKV